MAEGAGDAERIQRLFTRPDGSFRFARWGRPLAPVVVGTNDEGIRIFEEALRSVARLAGLKVGELDAEFGANFLVFFVNEWDQLAGIPSLHRLIPNIAVLAAGLAERGANQYRVFGFDDAGAIRICLTLLRYNEDLKKVSARTLATGQSLLGVLLWSENAFEAESPLALEAETGHCVIKPWHAALIRAAYDPGVPAASAEPALALRLAARIAVREERRP